MGKSSSKGELQRVLRRARRCVGLPLPAALPFVAVAGAIAGGTLKVLNARPFDLFSGARATHFVGLSPQTTAWTCSAGALAAVAAWLVLGLFRNGWRAAGVREELCKATPPFAPCYLLIALIPEYLWLDGPSIYSRFLFILCLGAVVLLGLLPVRISPDTDGSRFHPALIACLVLTALHALLFSTLSLRMFHAMNLGYTDSGVWAEALSNTLRGRFLHSNVFTFGNVLGDHMVPVLIFILPVFAIFPRHETLHVINAIALSAGAIPVFLLAWQRWRMPWPAFLMSIAYLVFPSISHLVFSYSYGFHPVILSLPLLLAALYFVVEGKLIRFWVFLGLALLANETVAIAVAALPPFILFRLKRKLLAASVFFVAISWFFLSVKVFIPLFRGGEPYWQVGSLYSHVGGSVSGMIKYAVAHPIDVAKLVFTGRKVGYLLQLLVPLGLLSLLSPTALAVAAPTALLLLLAERPDIQSIAFWNQVTLLPFIFLAAVDSVGKLGGIPHPLPDSANSSPSGRKRIKALSAFVLATSFISSYFFGYSPLSRGYNPNLFTVSQRDLLVKDLRGIIPRDASLCATDRIASHFIDQADLFVFMGEPREAQYVLLDLEENWRPLPPILEWRDKLLRDSDYGLIYFRANYLLFEKSAPDSTQYTTSIAAVEIPTEAQRIGLALAEGIVLMAARFQPVGAPSPGKCRLTLYWSAARKLERDHGARLTIVAGNSVTVVPPFHPLSGVHPTSLWRPGEIYADALDISFPFDPRNSPWRIGVEIMPEEHVPPSD